MNNIHLIKEFDFANVDVTDGDRKLGELFNGPHRRIVEVQLKKGSVLVHLSLLRPVSSTKLALPPSCI